MKINQSTPIITPNQVNNSQRDSEAIVQNPVPKHVVHEQEAITDQYEQKMASTDHSDFEPVGLSSQAVADNESFQIADNPIGPVGPILSQELKGANRSNNSARIHQIFSQSNLSLREIGNIVRKGLSPEQAKTLFDKTLNSYGQDLKKIGPQMVALAVLQTAANRPEGLSSHEIGQMIESFKDKAFVRPDGYMTDYLHKVYR